MAALSVRDLNVRYGPMPAVRGLSLQVEPGQIVALLGANGAGKSSTIRALAGLIGAQGTVTLEGREIGGLSAQRRVALGLGTVQEGRTLFRTLTVDENLRLGAFRRRDRAAVRRDLTWVYGLFPDLAARPRTRAALLSGGQAQMLAIGRALMTSPRVLLLDEPSLGLSPKLVSEVFELLQRLRTERGLSVLVVEQNARQALQIASYAYVLENGVPALQGDASGLLLDPRLQALYLGGSLSAPEAS